MPTLPVEQGCDPNTLSEQEMAALLRSGEQMQRLAAYFGTDEYRELRPLAKLAGTRTRRSRGTVYVLPGIMGSKLGSSADPHGTPLWLNPAAVERSELLSLALPSDRPLVASGVMLGAYMKLWLTLQIAGFEPRLHAYDWRQSIARSGKQLAERIAGDRSKHIMIVAHSMGGLVARAALPHLSHKKVHAVIQLGTPNSGSFAPIQAFRAVYPTVRKLATLDSRNSAEDLARKVFSTLPGLYELLPQSAGQTVDYFDAAAWPDDSLKPSIELLRAARETRAKLAAADDRCWLIAGVDRLTVTRAIKNGGFDYEVTHNGDGTVPLALARWSGAKTYYVREAHGGLTKNTLVCSAVVDLLQGGATSRLLTEWSEIDVVAQTLKESQMRRELTGKLRWQALPTDERRKILEPTIAEAFRLLADCKSLDSAQ